MTEQAQRELPEAVCAPLTRAGGAVGPHTDDVTQSFGSRGTCVGNRKTLGL